MAIAYVDMTSVLEVQVIQITNLRSIRCKFNLKQESSDNSCLSSVHAFTVY